MKNICSNSKVYKEIVLYNPGAMVHLNLANFTLSTDPLDNYLDANIAIKRFGERPIAMILQTNSLETLYQVLLQDKVYWVNLEACSDII